MAHVIQALKLVPSWHEQDEKPKRMRRSQKKAASVAQMQQRELAWILYITEGYIANMQKAAAVNCVTFEAKDQAIVDKVIRAADQAAEDIRRRMALIGE